MSCIEKWYFRRQRGVSKPARIDDRKGSFFQTRQCLAWWCRIDKGNAIIEGFVCVEFRADLFKTRSSCEDARHHLAKSLNQFPFFVGDGIIVGKASRHSAISVLEGFLFETYSKFVFLQKYCRPSNIHWLQRLQTLYITWILRSVIVVIAEFILQNNCSILNTESAAQQTYKIPFFKENVVHCYVYD